MKINVHLVFRLVAGIAVVIAFAVTPQLALAQAPGSLTQLASPNNCIESTSSTSTECQTKGPGLSGTETVAVSPDGKNVYALGFNDDAVAEFTRNPDGSLTQIGCIADSSAGEGTCSNDVATGLADPRAIAVSPDGQNVYVAAGLDPNGDIAEFTRTANGTLTPLAGHDCIAENETTGCADIGGHGLEFPNDLAISPDGNNVYVADQVAQAVTGLTRAADGSLSEPDGAADCIQDESQSSTECSRVGTGLSAVTGVAVSPDGDNVYTVGAPNLSSNGSIAEFTRNPSTGSLTQLSAPNNCVGTPEDDESCGSVATGVVGVVGLVVSPDGNNVYAASQAEGGPAASQAEGGPIAEFSRGTGGALTQLATPNDCIQEQNEDFGCGRTGTGIGSGFDLVVSPDGTNVYAAAPASFCLAGTCSDVAEFARNGDGSLSELANPDTCIQDSSTGGSECPGNENGSGLGGPGVAISPDGDNVYVTGTDGIAEFARGTHTLTVSPTGSGSGAVSDGTGAIACPSTCSHAYTANTQVTLTATPATGSTFTGWSGGGCSGTGTCQVTMSADTDVTATFTAPPPPGSPAPTPGSPAPTPGSPTPVLTGAPTAVTDGGAGFAGSVNPDGLATTAYFQYGLDKRYSQVGASGANYTSQTPAVQVGSDFTTHGVGPVTVTGLVPNALYHVRLVATNSAGTTFGQDVTFMTAHAPPPGPPTLGKTFNIEPVSGLVLLDINGHLVPLTELTQIPAGVAIDTRQGTLEVITATGGGGARDAAAKRKTQTGEFSGAVFRLSQVARTGLVTIMLTESAFKGAPSQSICKNNGAAADAYAASSRTIQLLHASAHGKFRTSGRYSAATVLGTIWTVTARCDGTLTHAIKDEVLVTDFVRHKSIILHAGQSYLAPGRITHK